MTDPTALFSSVSLGAFVWATRLHLAPPMCHTNCASPLLRHSSGTYDKDSNTGGSNYATMRYVGPQAMVIRSPHRLTCALSSLSLPGSSLRQSTEVSALTSSYSALSYANTSLILKPTTDSTSLARSWRRSSRSSPGSATVIFGLLEVSLRSRRCRVLT